MHATLKYGHRNGSGRQLETVDSAEINGYYNSIALDSAGRPHIVYSHETNYNLKYAHKP